MSLLFETKAKFLEGEAISTNIAAHKNFPIAAISSYNTNGGTVTIFDTDSGEPLKNVTFPNHPVSQTTSLCFHPSKQLLLTGWENGEILVWLENKREFQPIQGAGYHKSPIMLIEFSEQGGRLVTADSVSIFIEFLCMSLVLYLSHKSFLIINYYEVNLITNN
ncbi:hypothetical protein PVAND_014587 [Polypedilum vanderplanki]|uniref:IFT140 first beta-propeller domain-containing protein n=1 Tax=Polypedilum vanderplanki TaxID=319348 RepID=A0A9J6B9L7_POLVA|nr:hypothetical protein PVAND_014587 [Polypedilum vanderplanki]